MNCYYSNLIEGHDTHPVDIERALKADYSTDPEQRSLQLEARAHVEVQAWIDRGGLRGRATTVEAIRECHERFGNLLPEELLSVKDPDTGEEEVVVPGEFRKRDVKAAQHVPVSPGAVPRFLARFEVAYGGLGKSESVLAKAGMILEAVLFRGELLRGEVSRLLGTGNRQARRVVAALLERGVLVSESQRARLFLAFPASLASRWMPGLFPPQAGES